VITFPTLGMIGRLGNHLFQMAASISLALEHKEEYGFPRWRHEGQFILEGCFHDDLPKGEKDYHEPNFHYDPIPYEPGLRLHGFFQSEKYFGEHGETIRRLLSPRRMVPKIRGVASVQVRRGDYLLLPDKHPILGSDYYGAAVETLLAQGVDQFLVFSDDLAWCREHFQTPPFNVVPEMSDIEQFSLSLACEHHVMANSTFSWWTAWLDPNPEKVVIAPRKWFGPAYADFSTKDLIPSDWLVL
jgi:hypothetical protein